MGVLTLYQPLCFTSINAMQIPHIFEMILPAIRISGPNSILGLRAGCDA
jgi:hypothetical protein